MKKCTQVLEDNFKLVLQFYCYNAWNQEIKLHPWFQRLHSNPYLAKHWPTGHKVWYLLANSGLPCQYIIWQILNFGFVPKDI